MGLHRFWRLKAFRKEEAARGGKDDDVTSVNGEGQINQEFWVLEFSNCTTGNEVRMAFDMVES